MSLFLCFCRFLGQQWTAEGSLHLPGHCLGSGGRVQAFCHPPVHRFCLRHRFPRGRCPGPGQAGRLLLACPCCGSLHSGGKTPSWAAAFDLFIVFSSPAYLAAFTLVVRDQIQLLPLTHPLSRYPCLPTGLHCGAKTPSLAAVFDLFTVFPTPAYLTAFTVVITSWSTHEESAVTQLAAQSTLQSATLHLCAGFTPRSASAFDPSTVFPSPTYLAAFTLLIVQQAGLLP